MAMRSRKNSCLLMRNRTYQFVIDKDVDLGVDSVVETYNGSGGHLIAKDSVAVEDNISIPILRYAHMANRRRREKTIPARANGTYMVVVYINGDIRGTSSIADSEGFRGHGQ